MRPFTILAVAQLTLLASGAAMVPAYASAPKDDGVTVVPQANLPGAQPATPAAPTTESVQMDDGTVVTTTSGSTIVIQQDSKSGAYHVIVASGQ